MYRVHRTHAARLLEVLQQFDGVVLHADWTLLAGVAGELHPLMSDGSIRIV